MEGRTGVVAGLGLLGHDTTFLADKLVRRVAGALTALGGVHGEGYEIRHGRVHPDDGTVVGRGSVLATTWHGLLEGDAARHALLSWVTAVTDTDFVVGGGSHLTRRLADLDRLADAVQAHLDVPALRAIMARGAGARPGGRT